MENMSQELVSHCFSMTSLAIRYQEAVEREELIAKSELEHLPQNQGDEAFFDKRHGMAEPVHGICGCGVVLGFFEHVFECVKDAGLSLCIACGRIVGNDPAGRPVQNITPPLDRDVSYTASGKTEQIQPRGAKAQPIEQVTIGAVRILRAQEGAVESG